MASYLPKIPPNPPPKASVLLYQYVSSTTRFSPSHRQFPMASVQSILRTPSTTRFSKPSVTITTPNALIMKQKANCDVILKRIKAHTTKMITELEASRAERERKHREYMQQQQKYRKEQQEYYKEQQAYYERKAREDREYYDCKERERREYQQQQQQFWTNLFNKMQAMPPPTAYHHQNRPASGDALLVHQPSLVPQPTPKPSPVPNRPVSDTPPLATQPTLTTTTTMTTSETTTNTTPSKPPPPVTLAPVKTNQPATIPLTMQECKARFFVRRQQASRRARGQKRRKNKKVLRLQTLLSIQEFRIRPVNLSTSTVPPDSQPKIYINERPSVRTHFHPKGNTKKMQMRKIKDRYGDGWHK